MKNLGFIVLLLTGLSGNGNGQTIKISSARHTTIELPGTVLLSGDVVLNDVTIKCKTLEIADATTGLWSG